MGREGYGCTQRGRLILSPFLSQTAGSGNWAGGIMETLAQWIRAHGFRVEKSVDSLTVWIPWLNVETRETGEEAHTVRTWAEARHVLGY